MTTLLETNGFTPLSAEDGEEGLALALREKPSLIILDILMPKMSGIKMMQELKKDPALQGIPVIILSAISEKTFTHSYQRMGRQGNETVHKPAAYIEKPPESEDLLEAIQKGLAQIEKVL